MAATCSGCGKAIAWATSTKSGKKIPIDFAIPDGFLATARAGSVYVVYPDEAERRGGFVSVWNARPWKAGDAVYEGERLGVSHFATCSKASDFSGTGRRRAPRR